MNSDLNKVDCWHFKRPLEVEVEVVSAVMVVVVRRRRREGGTDATDD